MQTLKQLSTILCLSILLSACSSDPYRSKGPIYDPYAVKPKPAQTKRYENNTTIPERQIIDESSYVAEQIEAAPQQPASPAVLALLDTAESNSKAGNLNAAASSVERALRIQPRNPELVYKLAQIRLKQGKPRLAEDLGKKADILSAGNPKLKKQIWTLIADARRRQGKQQSAAEAAAKAELY